MCERLPVGPRALCRASPVPGDLGQSSFLVPVERLSGCFLDREKTIWGRAQRWLSALRSSSWGPPPGTGSGSKVSGWEAAVNAVTGQQQTDGVWEQAQPIQLSRRRQA